MIFYFPGQIAYSDLDLVLSNFFRATLAANGIEEVSELQISIVGWREGHRCVVADAQGALTHLMFDRFYEEDGTPVNEWVPRPGVRIYNLQKPRLQPARRVKANGVG